LSFSLSLALTFALTLPLTFALSFPLPSPWPLPILRLRPGLALRRLRRSSSNGIL
jgi:hypothetical protein